MSGPWLASYIVLWAVVLFQGVAIFVLLRQLGIMYLGTAQGVARDGLAPGTKAPEFTLPDVDGRTVSLADFRGRSLMLVFGSPTCRPCRDLLPDLHRFATERRAEMSVLFLCRADQDEAKRFATELDIHVPVAVHADETLPEQYKARVTPFGFLIDSEGVVRAKGLTNNYEHLELIVRSAREQKQRHNGAAASQQHPAEEDTR
jgi:methylamine dehydrogenase accessory protein MauD